MACEGPGELHWSVAMEGAWRTAHGAGAGAEAGEGPSSSTDEAVQAHLHFL